MTEKTNKNKNKRLSLTLLFALVIQLFLIVDILFTLVIGFILIKTNVITLNGNFTFSPIQTILLMGLTSVVLGAIIAAAVSRFPMRPVNTLVKQMNRLASGDYSARITANSVFAKNHTVKTVCDSFNKLAEELEGTEMLRSDFINNFSHEFKTPIVSIAGFAKLLRKGNLTEDQKEEYLEIIEEESMRLAAMATNVLNLTKYENQTILTDVTEYNLSEQIRSSILTLEAKWIKKSIEFNIDFDEYMICANKDMLKQVFINLIDNAIKFSEDYGAVDIRIYDNKSTYSVSVTNFGEDIPESEREHIFNKFYQADRSHSTEGNGIGLALVKKITLLHRGTVSLSSNGGVTTFTVTLPKKQ